MFPTLMHGKERFDARCLSQIGSFFVTDSQTLSGLQLSSPHRRTALKGRCSAAFDSIRCKCRFVHSKRKRKTQARWRRSKQYGESFTARRDLSVRSSTFRNSLAFHDEKADRKLQTQASARETGHRARRRNQLEASFGCFSCCVRCRVVNKCVHIRVWKITQSA